MRFPVPNLSLFSSKSVDQGALFEKNSVSALRASSQVMFELISCVLGHLTQNHSVVSSFSPRIYGSQFSSSVGGMRSGLVSTPIHVPLLSISLQDRPHRHTNRPLATRVVFFGECMRTLIDKVGWVDLSDGGGPRIEEGHTFTGNCEQDNTTRPLHVGCCEVPYQVHLVVLTSDEETCAECEINRHVRGPLRTNLVSQ